MAKKTKASAQINDPDFDMLLSKYYAARNNRLLATKTEEELKEEIGPMVTPYHREHGADIYELASMKVEIRNQDGAARIDGKRLLELGVDPEIVEKATNKTPYVQYVVSVREQPLWLGQSS